MAGSDHYPARRANTDSSIPTGWLTAHCGTSPGFSTQSITSAVPRVTILTIGLGPANSSVWANETLYNVDPNRSRKPYLQTNYSHSAFLAYAFSGSAFDTINIYLQTATARKETHVTLYISQVVDNEQPTRAMAQNLMKLLRSPWGQSRRVFGGASAWSYSD